MAVIPLRKSDPWSFEQAHSGATLSSRIVDDVCAALFAKRLAPGDFLGTEKDIAERAGASRIVARDARAARRAMDDHVKMIRARRVNEGGDDPTPHCC
jgi:DNA-binding FadR family transcriptional regulator